MSVAVQLVPSMVDIDREAIRRRGLAEFLRRSWSLIEPSAPLRWSWHLDAICEHLEAVTRREIRDLVITIPPGCTKSLSASVAWPAWVWTHKPGNRFIATSYSNRLVLRDAQKHRDLVKSTWYRERWPHVVIPSGKAMSDAVSVFKTTRGGFRFSTTVHGELTGEHTDDLLADDPINPQSAASTSGIELDEVLRWWHETVPTRFRDHTTSARVCIMQRLHVRDLAADMIREGATVLCLPMRFERNHPHAWRGATLTRTRSPTAPKQDPRTVEGELLVPERLPAAELAKVEKVLGPTATAAQMQQRPAPAEGGIFKKAWLQHYWVTLPKGGTWGLTFDCAFKDTQGSDFVAGQGWYQHGANFYLVHRVFERLDFNATCELVVRMSVQTPTALLKLVEDKANGPAVINVLKAKVPGLVAVNPEGGKIARAHACEPLFAAGNVFVPHPELAEMPDGSRGAPWVRNGRPLELDAAEGSYEHSMVTFPNAANDDDVDATTQYLNHVSGGYAALLEQAMANFRRNR